jgi:hypothetical protein
MAARLMRCAPIVRARREERQAVGQVHAAHGADAPWSRERSPMLSGASRSS